MKLSMIYPDPSTEKGISAYSLNLIKNLKKKKIDITNITFRNGNFSSLLKKRNKLLENKIIHIQHEYNLLGGFGIPFFFLIGYLFLKKKKQIITMHTVLSQKEKFKSGTIKTFLRKKLYILQNKWIGLLADRIIVHCENFKKILTEEYKLKEEKIKVLPHPIIEKINTISQADAKKELNLKGPVYLLIGSMIYDHGHDIVLRNAKEIGETILVATNPSKVNDRNTKKIKNFLEENKSIVKTKGLEKLVRFDIGPINYEKWWKYFTAADLIILPYRGGIGSGIFADAMAMKKPVIASNIDYFKEIKKNYGCLKLVKDDKDYALKIKSAMTPTVNKNMIKECKRYIKINGYTPIIKKYNKIYSSL